MAVMRSSVTCDVCAGILSLSPQTWCIPRPRNTKGSRIPRRLPQRLRSSSHSPLIDCRTCPSLDGPCAYLSADGLVQLSYRVREYSQAWVLVGYQHLV